MAPITHANTTPFFFFIVFTSEQHETCTKQVHVTKIILNVCKVVWFIHHISLAVMKFLRSSFLWNNPIHPNPYFLLYLYESFRVKALLSYCTLLFSNMAANIYLFQKKCLVWFSPVSCMKSSVHIHCMPCEIIVHMKVY